jgi:elongation factor 1-beta
MGNVIVVFRLMPDSPDSFEAVKAGAQKLKPERLEEEPIAFGLKALKFTAVIPDEEGTMPALEEKLSKIKHIQSVETLMVSRSL